MTQESREFKVSGSELAQWRSQARRSTQSHQIPLGEVDWLLREITNLTALELRLESFATQPEIVLRISLAELAQRWQRRLEDRSPIQYLAGSTPWRDLTLQVAPGVLIPRPETEILIDLAIAATQQYPELAIGNWVDMGTGSGESEVAPAQAFPEVIIHGVDRSLEALAIAQANAEKYGYSGSQPSESIVGAQGFAPSMCTTSSTTPKSSITKSSISRINFYQGSWWSPLEFLQGKVQGMISNPPYIPTNLITKLQPEVANHEPYLALDGGEDGLDDLRHLVTTAPHYLKSGGIWLVETMAGQPPAVVRLLREQGSYRDIYTFSDLAGIERFVQAFKI
jgi:release factor glutamine methyltransferase